MIKIIGFILGIFLCSLSLFFIILYLNMMNIGYSFSEFVNFIIRQWECYLIIIGIILITVSLWKGKNK